MAELKPEVKKEPKLKVKIITAGDYMLKARELFGPDKVWDNAIALIYTECKILAVLERKGETKFVVEA